MSDAWQQQRRFVYLLIISLAAAQALARVTTTTRLYSPAHPWPRNPVHTPLLSANDRSRWCTVWSLVERGTYQIDEIIGHRGWDTIDKGRHQDHFYSSKPPFLSTLVAGVYWVLKRGFGFDLLERTHETVQVILLIVNWIPWVLSLVLLAAISERYARSDWSRLFLVATAACGTFLSTFLTTLNNHSLAASSVVFSLYPLLRILNDDRRQGLLFALAGFWGGCAACCEIPAALYGLALFALLVRAAPRQTLTWFIPAAAVPLVFFFATNWICTGSLKPFYANFANPQDTFYRYVHNGVPSYWMNPQGLDQGESSALRYFLHCTIGHHGIFSLSPVFLLTLAGWTRLRGASPLRVAGLLSLVLTVWVLAFYLGQTHSYNYGGTTSGLRWAFWLIPLWLVALLPALDAWGERTWVRVLCGVLLAVSVFSATLPGNNPWQHPWLMNVLP